MKRQAILIVAVITMSFGIGRVVWAQEDGRRLLNNERWLKNHPGVARNLYQDKEFLRKHPDIAKNAQRRGKLLKKHGVQNRDNIDGHKRHRRDFRTDKKRPGRDAMRDSDHDKRKLRRDHKNLKRDKKGFRRDIRKKRRNRIKT
ncbi:MAG: hypothetical protein ACE5KZ_03775 [Candidatus Scalinduaceae bacterium]